MIVCSVFAVSYPSFNAPLLLTYMLASPSDQPRADSLELSRFLPYFLGKMAVFDNMELLQLDDASFAWSFVLVMKAFVFTFKGTGCNCRDFLVQWQSRTYMDDFTNNMYQVIQLEYRMYQQYV